MNKKDIASLLSVLLGLSGFFMLGYFVAWPAAIAVFLIILGNNINLGMIQRKIESLLDN